MNHLKISIVTTSYNRKEYLEELIDSILCQNYPNLEYIILDGGSTDGSVEVIKKYEKHLTYWISEKDEGFTPALNKGLQMTTGEIMGWMNSDDKYLQGSFALINEIFSTFKDVRWITGKSGVWDEKGNFVKEIYNFRNIYDYLLDNVYESRFKRFLTIQQESTFWRRSLWDQTESYIDEKYKIMPDSELWTRFFLYEDLWHVDGKIGGFRVHKSSNTYINHNLGWQDLELAISTMKNKLNERQLNNYNILSRLNILRDQAIFASYSCYEKSIELLFEYNIDFADADYKIIRKEGNEWKKYYMNFYASYLSHLLLLLRELRRLLLIEQSFSWRITRPLRIIRKLMTRLREKIIPTSKKELINISD